ncbi:MAG: hypothetical protein ACI9UN_003585 [Granulosicoccus sp.]|jgi:hypothetical protein
MHAHVYVLFRGLPEKPRRRYRVQVAGLGCTGPCLVRGHSPKKRDKNALCLPDGIQLGQQLLELRICTLAKHVDSFGLLRVR